MFIILFSFSNWNWCKNAAIQSSLTLVRALMWGLQVSHFGATTFLKCAGGLCSWLLGLSGNYPMDLYVIHMPQLLNTFCIKGDNFGDNPKTSHSKMFMSYQNAISHHNKEKNNSKTASEWQLYRYSLSAKFSPAGFISNHIKLTFKLKDKCPIRQQLMAYHSRAS